MPDQQSTQTTGKPFEIITSPKRRGFSPKGFFAVFAVLAFLGLSVATGVYLVQQRTNLTQRAAPATSIAIIPASQTQTPGSNFTFSVSMDTATNAVTAFDLRLNFDPNAIQITSLEQGSGATHFTAFSNTYDNGAGTISYAAFNVDTSRALVGSGIEILKVNATVRNTAVNGNYNITFDPATAATATQEGQNVLISKTQGVVVVQQSVNTASPSPSPTTPPGTTATPTATATATAAATPTRSPSSQPTATGTAQATATATAQSTATAQPTSNPTNNAVATATATASPIPLPVTGINWPTYLAVGFAILTVLAAFILAI